MGENMQFSDHQTSTPVTNSELSFRSASKQYARTHRITHKNITSINMESSEDSSFKLRGGNPVAMEGETIESSKTSEETEQRRVLSPEQLGVRSFLEKRKRSSGSFPCFPGQRLNLSGSPPAASSTFRNGLPYGKGSPEPALSPVSFTMKHDLTGGSQMSYADILDESQIPDKKQQQALDPNSPILSELSCTFRNDSQMVAMGEEENLPGYTTNFVTTANYMTTDSEAEAENQPPGTRMKVEADIEADGVGIIDTYPVRMDLDLARSQDGTTLTNVTEFSADEVDSFMDKKDEHSKSIWRNKDVFMFYKGSGIEPGQGDNLGSVQQKSRKYGKNNGATSHHDVAPTLFKHSVISGIQKAKDSSVDETGDSKKPPVPGRHEIATERVNFLQEAEERLAMYKSRRQHEISPGVCLEKLQRQSIVQSLQTGSSENISSANNVSENNIEEHEDQEIRTNETCEFEEMERKFQDESIRARQGVRLSKSLTDVTKQGLSPLKGYGRSASCSNSVDGDTRSLVHENARYHFLHEKGMIKISSPGLKIVNGNSARTRGHEITDIEEEENSDLLKSGSESDINDFVIDNKFSLLGTSDIVSSRSTTSDLTTSNNRRQQQSYNHGSTLAQCQMILSQHEANVMGFQEQQSQLLDSYMRTVDQGHGRWDNVLTWMDQGCGQTGDHELQEELDRLVGQVQGTSNADRDSAEEGTDRTGTNTPVDGTNKCGASIQAEGTMGQETNNMVDDSVYYSFHGQSEELRNILAATQEEQNQDEICSQEDDQPFSSLMETILHGTVQQVQKLLNSDRTISEMEIREATAWALDNENFAIAHLLLLDVCRLLEAAEGENYIDVYPAYRKGHRWDPLFVVLSKQNFQGEWDFFMGFPVYRRRHDFVSREAAVVINSDLVRNNPLSIEDFATLRGAIKSAELNKHHRYVTVVNACPYRSRKGGEVLEKGLCIVIHCLLKGFIPFDEEPFPEEISGIPVDVREAYFQLGIRTSPHHRGSPDPQLEDDSSQPQPHPQHSSNDSLSASDKTSGSECRTGSQSSDGNQSGSSFSNQGSYMEDVQGLSGSVGSCVEGVQGMASRMMPWQVGRTDSQGMMGPTGDTMLDKVVIVMLIVTSMLFFLYK